MTLITTRVLCDVNVDDEDSEGDRCLTVHMFKECTKLGLLAQNKPLSPIGGNKSSHIYIYIYIYILTIHARRDNVDFQLINSRTRKCNCSIFIYGLSSGCPIYRHSLRCILGVRSLKI